MSKNPQHNIFNIPSGISFAAALAAQLLRETESNPEALSSYRIFLPTRRACRTVRDIFLKFSGGKPLLLPRMQPLGDMDVEELSLTLFDGQDLGIPPGISPLRRQVMLARTIEGIEGFSQGPAQALMLAEALGQFIDQIVIEERDINNLAEIVPEDFANHWQITLEFLKILSEHWPRILEEHNVLDVAERRKRLIYALVEKWQTNPPNGPVIAAGSTGSMPATAALLSTISQMPQGRVILPGLDPHVDQESWDAVEETHPQYGLKQLLDRIDCGRDQVSIWPGCENMTDPVRTFLATEIMRPTETSDEWQNLVTSQTAKSQIVAGLDRLKYFECENTREESQIISMIMREALEEKERTVALITPDRSLARRVAMMCERWGIQVDDSAGQLLDATDIGSFMIVSAQACLNEFSPVSVLALLKHKFCFCNHNYETFRKNVDDLEVLALRGLRPPPGLDGIKQKNQEVNNKNLNDLLMRLEPMTHRFVSLVLAEKPQKFSDFLAAHLDMIEALSGENHTDSQTALWSGEAGETMASFISDLRDHADDLPSVSAHDYVDILMHFMRSVSVRPRYGTHPRLTILGQLEARLIDADLIILSGLNEGTWPPQPAHDPWMSRPMRKTFGLPAPERMIGLAAHDFVQGFSAPDVVITRSKRVEGAPAVPARWLQRLSAVLEAANEEIPCNPEYFHWAKMLDEPEEVTPIQRPAPTPPLEKRPKTLSVTRIEPWLKDPYQIYARSVLKLKKLDPLEKTPDAAERGTVLHNILDRFVREHPRDVPDNAQDILFQIAQDEISNHHDDQAVWSYWWSRFHNLTSWYVAQERNWRTQAKPGVTEAKGKITIGDFTLTAVADRIDSKQNGLAAIIDYKSGGTFNPKGIADGKYPQLPLEALILQHGGFENMAGQEVETLSYWVMPGGRKGGEVVTLEQNIEQVIENARAGLEGLIASFDDPQTPYYSLPNPDDVPRFNDYEHLARVKEWAALDDTTEAA